MREDRVLVERLHASRAARTVAFLLAASIGAFASTGCAASLGLNKYTHSDVSEFANTSAKDDALLCVDALASERHSIVRAETGKKATALAGGAVTLLGGFLAAVLGASTSAELDQKPGVPLPPPSAKVNEVGKVGTVVAAGVAAGSGLASLIAGVIPPNELDIARFLKREKHYNAAKRLAIDRAVENDASQQARSELDEATERFKESQKREVAAKRERDQTAQAIGLPGGPPPEKGLQDAVEAAVAISARDRVAWENAESKNKAAQTRLERALVRVKESFINCKSQPDNPVADLAAPPKR